MQDNALLRVLSKVLIPLIMIFALYVQFHGDYGPGGGFQAGVVFVAGIVLHSLIFGLEATRAAVPQVAVRITLVGGVLLYGGVGVVCMLLGGNFLDYDVLAHDAVHGQHIGIILVEFGVGLTVAGAIAGIYFVFAGRGRIGHAGQRELSSFLGLYNYWIVVLLIMIGFYIVIGHENLMKKLIGLTLFQTGVFVFYISTGSIEGATAPILVEGEALYAHPLPHVLILTAIVVGVATTALGLALVVRIHEAYGSTEEDDIIKADREGPPQNESSTA